MFVWAKVPSLHWKTRGHDSKKLSTRIESVQVISSDSDLKEQLDIPHTLSELGMDENYRPDLIQLALADPSCSGNPIPLEQHHLKLILDNALKH